MLLPLSIAVCLNLWANQDKREKPSDKQHSASEKERKIKNISEKDNQQVLEGRMLQKVKV